MEGVHGMFLRSGRRKDVAVDTSCSTGDLVNYQYQTLATLAKLPGSLGAF